MAQTATVGLSDGDEFVGPFASWTNVKTAYGAAGDGVTDDTAALQNALNNVGVNGHAPVLYLPAGTYRITSTLQIATVRQGISIIGQDPSLVAIKWAGASYEEMLYLNGLSYSKISRITWDGSGTALTGIDYGWNGQGSFGGSTYDEDSDEVFKNLQFGIRGGTLGYEDSEHAILRCVFSGITRAAVSVENYNALDWYVWDSTFTNDYVGVTNIRGGGNFHVIGSLFQSSTYADIEIGPTSFFSLRENFSQNSSAFVIASATGSASAALTLQSNIILDTIQSPLQISNPGPVMLFDNIIRGNSSQTSALITVVDSIDNPSTPGDLVAIGNTVSENNWYSVPNGGDVIDINNNISSRSAITANAPTMPGALPNYGRVIYDVAAGSNAAAIQAQIDAAVALNGQRPVVHLPASQLYSIENTIVLPVGSDVQLVGDGGGVVAGTALTWVGPSSGQVIRMPGPSRATLRDLDIVGGTAGADVLVQNADQTSGRVFMEQLQAENMTQSGLFVNGLDNAQVTVHNGYITSDNIGIQVTGGPKAIAGQSVSVRNDMFAGLTASNNLTYNLSTHGRLMSQDVWYEGGPAQFVNFSDSGVFTLHGAHIAAQDAAHGGVQQNIPTFEVDNFSGSVSLLAAQIEVRNTIGVLGNGAGTSMMAMGILGPDDNSNFFGNSTSPPGQVALVASRQATTSSGSLAVVPDQVSNISSESAFILNMVAQTRTEQAQAFAALPAGITDSRMYRVSVNGGVNGVEVDSTGPTSTTAPNISGVAVSVPTSTTATITWTTDQPADSQVFYGTTTSYGSSSTLNISDVTSHSVSLSNLTPGVTYHFIVKSRSLSGYISSSSDGTFVATVTAVINNTPVSGNALLTGFTTGTMRNNFTGYVGMQFTVGSTAITVNALGRAYFAGNTGSHIVKLVQASNGADVAGAAATVTMAGGTTGTFTYAELSSPVSLAANTAYYLVSQETSGGDQWSNVTPVSVSSAASIQAPIYQSSSSYVPVPGSANYSYVPANLMYSAGSSGTTVTSPSGTQSLVTGESAGNLRNNFTGWVGFQLTVASTALQVQSLGRMYIAGNSASHTVKLVQASNGQDVPGGSVSVSGGTAGQFTYGTLSSPVTLSAYTAYYLVSQETSGGDQWYDYEPISTTSAAAVNGPIYEIASQPYSLVGVGGSSYVPVSLLYSSGSSGSTSTSPPTVSITAPASGATVSGTSVALTATATAASGLSIASVQFKVDGANTGSALTSAPYSTTFNSTALSNGSHSFTAVATDSAGNSTTSAAVTVTVSNTSSSSTGTGVTTLITAFSPGSIRNDYTGFVGMAFTVGSSPITVATLGRIYVSGNTGTHTVKLVQANGTDVAGGSVQVALPGGAVAGQFAYGTLASPVTLAAGASYYLVSQETQGGDQWYNIGAVAATSAATVTAPVYFTGSSYSPVPGYGSQSYVPVNLSYTLSSSGSATPTSDPALITGFSVGNIRNDYTGWVGMAFTVGSSPITVAALGRIYVSGNTGTHTVKLVQANGTDVAGGSVQVVLPGGTVAGQFAYGNLASPVTLAAGTSYYLVSQETFGGDQWYNIGAVTAGSAATVTAPVYYSGSNYVYLAGYGSQSYVPVNLLY